MLSRSHVKILDNLVENNALSDEDYEQIINDSDVDGQDLDLVILEELKIEHNAYLVAKGSAYNVPPINIDRYEVGDYCFEYLDLEFCKENRILPVGSIGNELAIATCDPLNPALKEQIEAITRKPFFFLLAHQPSILAVLDKDSGAVGNSIAGFQDVVEALGMEFDVNPDEVEEEDFESEESRPIVLLTNRIIEDAYFSGASDIHVEPTNDNTRIRVRIDGKCRERLTIPNIIARSVVARCKVMANLDVAERRKPQDGRIPFENYNRKGIDLSLRLSTSPQQYGEGAVMRLIDKQKSTLPLEALGFSEDNLKMYKRVIHRPYGMILHCGPTGAGKSMTLYSALNEINSPDKNIRTAEDPIEYTLAGVIQVQMDRRIPVTFASTLRAFLRQDPDIILVGEIRDKETATIAVEAAMTGHLLFSTLHTNDAASTVTRLSEIGVEPFLISSTLVCVCSQRLIRRLCDTCKLPHDPNEEERRIMEAAIGWSGEILKAKHRGCPNCGNSGYRKRTGIHEVMVNNELLTNAINRGASLRELKEAAVANGMTTLHQDCMEKVRMKMTSFEECLVTVPPDDTAPADVLID